MKRALAAAACACALSCSTTTTFREAIPSPHRELTVHDHVYGEVGEGVDVPVGMGFQPLRWQVREGGEVVAQGEVERDQVIWGVVLGAAAAAACCVPTLAASGFCLANPLASAGCLAGNIGGVVAACQAPGWSSIPMVALGSAVGSTPLLFGLVGAHPPPEVIVQTPAARRAPSPAPTPTPAAPAATPSTTSAGQGDMWF